MWRSSRILLHECKVELFSLVRGFLMRKNADLSSATGLCSDISKHVMKGMSADIKAYHLGSPCSAFWNSNL